MPPSTDARALLEAPEPELGHHFVANYPPFSAWTSPCQAAVEAALERPSAEPLGLYAHIPFCRKRCHFCYFRVYTGQDAATVAAYSDALVDELALYARRPALAGRKFDFLYFGGGTPSYLSSTLLGRLFERLQAQLAWRDGAEVAFECEPGTATRAKLSLLRQLGVTRLSMGFESLDDAVLEAAGRAHRAADIEAAYATAVELGFAQINVDLISGLPGETDQSWDAGVERVVGLSPHSVTIYPLEVPRNTTLHREARAGRDDLHSWATRRQWSARAFERLAAAGYQASSAYTTARGQASFGYRDLLWRGADLLALGTSAFSHLAGTHFQNLAHMEPYLEALGQGRLPLWRGYAMSQDEALVRQFILQLKLGRVAWAPLRQRFGVDPRQRFAEGLEALQRDGLAQIGADAVTLATDALQRVDRLLPLFFLPQHREVAYA